MSTRCAARPHCGTSVSCRAVTTPALPFRRSRQALLIAWLRWGAATGGATLSVVVAIGVLAAGVEEESRAQGMGPLASVLLNTASAFLVSLVTDMCVPAPRPLPGGRPQFNPLACAQTQARLHLRGCAQTLHVASRPAGGAAREGGRRSDQRPHCACQHPRGEGVAAGKGT